MIDDQLVVTLSRLKDSLSETVSIPEEELVPKLRELFPLVEQAKLNIESRVKIHN